jgi:oligopeptide/dipeptide ABC transporter ATP-binding protein
MSRLLSVHDLHVRIPAAFGTVHAVRGLNLEIGEGEIHGMVGESGSGKSISAKSLLRLAPTDGSERTGSAIFASRVDLLGLGEREMMKLRGREISMVFQDPSSSLNPLMTIGRQAAETLRKHLGLSKAEAAEKAIDVLKRVGISPAERRSRQYPHEFSGGMLQRAMIAIAIACGPKLLLADEPTTALDVTIQAQILKLFKELSRERGIAILLITHNLGVAAEICDSISVMYAGRAVETGRAGEVLSNPLHPYTQALLSSAPGGTRRGQRLKVIPGSPPSLRGEMRGCAFAPRCPYSSALCRENDPGPTVSPSGRSYCCHAHVLLEEAI